MSVMQLAGPRVQPALRTHVEHRNLRLQSQAQQAPQHLNRERATRPDKNSRDTSIRQDWWANSVHPECRRLDRERGSKCTIPR